MGKHESQESDTADDDHSIIDSVAEDTKRKERTEMASESAAKRMSDRHDLWTQ